MARIFGSTKAMNYFTFERFRVSSTNAEAYRAAREFDCKKHNIYLYGPAGTGKTHLAYALAKMYALSGSEVIIATPMRVVDTFRTKSDAEKEDRFREYTECDLLLIDDLGISKHTDFALEVICELLNRRTLQMRNGLVVTSNLSLDKIADKNRDDRLTSRLAGLCEVVELTGTDHRLLNR